MHFKVHIFWEGHTIMWNLYHRFDRYYIGQIYGGDFTKFVAFSEYLIVNYCVLQQKFTHKEILILLYKQRFISNTIKKTSWSVTYRFEWVSVIYWQLIWQCSAVNKILQKTMTAKRLREKFASSNNVAFLQKKTALITWLLSI